jgi:hypothetical protein
VIVVDASCLYEVVVGSPRAEHIRTVLAADPDHAAPHVVDIEVYSLIRRDHLAGVFDETLAALAVEDLRSWPGERYGHRGLLARARELRHTVRGVGCGLRRACRGDGRDARHARPSTRRGDRPALRGGRPGRVSPNERQGTMRQIAASTMISTL